MNKLFLLDGMALVYRGHFALMRNPRLTSKGLNTSALYALANTLAGILDQDRPTHIAAVFDTPEPTHRHRIYAPYKEQRQAMPEELSAAIPYVFRLCEAFNVPVLRLPGWEADDLIGTLARRAEEAGFETYMVTPDKDYAQLVSERTFVCKPGRTGTGAEIEGVEQILARWRIERVEQVIDILGLMGDSSDNVPGVPGIGAKTAQKLIAQYGSLEELLEHLDDFKGKRRENLEQYREQALLSKKLVTIERHVPLEIELEDLQRRAWNEEALRALFAELEFNTLGKRLLGEDFQAGPRRLLGAGGEEVLKTLKEVEHEYTLADTAPRRRALLEELMEQKSFCFDIETTGLDPGRCEIIGLAFSWAPHSGCYVPFPEEGEASRRLLEEFRPLFENARSEKIGHHLKFDLGVLRRRGLEVEGRLFDTLLAAYVVEPEMRRTMDYLAEALLGYRPIPIAALIGEQGQQQKTLRQVPLEQVAEYAAEDADITLQLSRVLRRRAAAQQQEKVIDEVECPLVPVLVEMEYEGIRLDLEVLRELAGELTAEIERAAEQVYALAGERFNLNSPRQLGEILFDKLKLDPHARRTRKTGQYQTSEQILRRLEFRHEIVRQVLHYRMCTKLKSTYVDMLPGAVDKRTGRVHTHYEQAVAATGRLQAQNPNLQTIPIRTELGRKIRRAFVPRSEEYLLLAADYSQIELRVAAELSKDEAMLEIFRRGGDIHTATATRIYGVEAAGATERMRRQAKTVNFGIIYGISPFGLAERLEIGRGEAAALIEHYFAQFPGARRYMEQTIEFARAHGYVETATGRRRYLREINSRNATVRKAAERNAINAPIQGTAADMIKIAMSRIYRQMRERGLRSKLLLQVHDELLFDMHRDEAEVLPPLVEKAMVEALPMEVPIVVEMGKGENWLEAH